MRDQTLTAFETQLRAELPTAVFRPLSQGYLEEPRGRFEGRAGLILAPSETAEVSAIARLAHEMGVGLVPYGGGTGLVGGQISEAPGAIALVTLERMTRIRAVYPEENVMIAEAGVILADVQTAASEVERLFPLSLASEGSARIGGLLATNAGGVNVLRYGNARDLCLGLEVVMADGAVWNGLTRLRKDNTGYDLRNLMIGSEGSLGIITAATLRLFPQPQKLGTAMMVVPGPEAALELLALAGRMIGPGIAAFELIHRMGLDFLSEVMPQVRLPFAERPEWSVLVDIGLAGDGDAQAALTALFEAGLAAGLVSDGLVAQSETQRADFWAVRESIPEANRLIGSVSSHDISVPLGQIAAFVAEAPGKLADLAQFRINCFGHLGDGNLHYNVFPMPGKTRADYEDVRGDVKRVIHDLVHEKGGSVSAEHGIGRLKVADLERYGDPTKLAAMRALKTALDPKGILNPGAVLRQK